MLSAGVYGLNFRHDGFYPENATGYSYYREAGWESVYAPKVLQQCPERQLRPQAETAQTADRLRITGA